MERKYTGELVVANFTVSAYNLKDTDQQHVSLLRIAMLV